MRGYNIPDLVDGSQPIGDLNVGGFVQVVPDQPVNEEIIEGVQAEGAQAKGVEDAIFNPQSPKTESDVNNVVDGENLVNVPFD